jgi:hypothetical protein
MRRVPAIALVLLLAAAFPFISEAQESGFSATPIQNILPGYPPGSGGYDFATGIYTATNELFQYHNATLMSDAAKYNPDTGEVIADGHVRIQEAGQMWIGDHIIYNLKTHQMESGGFRTGKAPVYAEGATIHGTVTNKNYSAQYVYVTTDNVSRPDYYIRAKRMRIVPGK